MTRVTYTPTTVAYKNANYAAQLGTLGNGQQVALFEGPRGAQLTLFVHSGEVMNMGLKTVGTASLVA